MGHYLPMRKLIRMHANNNYQIQETLFFRKEKKMMIYALQKRWFLHDICN